MREAAGSWGAREIPAALRDRYLREGFWSDETLGGFVAEGAAKFGDRLFRVRSAQRPFDGKIADVFAMALRVREWLAAQGVGPGDVVASHLPNWAEAAAAVWGASLAGAVVVPIVHFYGPKEVSFILKESGARILFSPSSFRSRDFASHFADYRRTSANLEHIVAVGEPSADALPWEETQRSSAPARGAAEVSPDAPALIAYTSGTTANPKGVIHAHRTLVASIRLGRKSQDERPPLVGSPVGHVTGMLQGVYYPLDSGRDVELIDYWDPATVLAEMARCDLSFSGGPPFFLTSLVEHPSFDPKVHLRRMKSVGFGGSAILPAVVEHAERLGITVTRAYGSTETQILTQTLVDDEPDKRLYTDGRAVRGAEVRIVDEDGRDLPAEAHGEVLARTPTLFIGYTDPAMTAAAVDADGWYHTGDIGLLDEAGFLKITDRKQDIVIRGGENISAAEIEELMWRMEGVAEVAVVAAPSQRLGEQVCACIRPPAGAAGPSLQAVKDFMATTGIARQKWPELVRIVDEFPRTPSGKIKKFELRRMLRDEASSLASLG